MNADAGGSDPPTRVRTSAGAATHDGPRARDSIGRARLLELREREPRRGGEVLQRVRLVTRTVGRRRRVPQDGHRRVLRSGRLDDARGDARSGGAPTDLGALLHRDARGRRAPRRSGGEVHRRRGGGHLRPAGRARGRRASGRARRGRDARASRVAERGLGDPARGPDRGDHGRSPGAGRRHTDHRRRDEHGFALAIGCRIRRGVDRRVDLASRARGGRDRTGRAAACQRQGRAGLRLARGVPPPGQDTERDAVRRARPPYEDPRRGAGGRDRRRCERARHDLGSARGWEVETGRCLRFRGPGTHDGPRRTDPLLR